MTYSDMTPYFIWGGMIQFATIWSPVEHGAWDILFLCLLLAALGIRFARSAWRMENPKQPNTP